VICQLPDENTAERLRFSTFSGHVRCQAVKEDGQPSTACVPLSLFLKNVNGIQRTKARVEIIFFGKGLSFSMSRSRISPSHFTNFNIGGCFTGL